MDVEIRNERHPVRLGQVLSEALEIFSHSFQSVYNKLVVSGTDLVLVECLEKVLTDGNMRQAVPPICQLLLRLYYCEHEQFQDSIAIVGGDLFPPLLATVFIGATEHEEFTTPAKNLLKKVDKMSIDFRDVPWAHSLLDTFQEVAESASPETHLKPLSFFMQWLVEGIPLKTESNKSFVMKHPEFFDSIAANFSSDFRPGRPLNVYVSRFIKLLSQSTSSRSRLIQKRGVFQLLLLLFCDNNVESKTEVVETLALIALDRSGRTKILVSFDHTFFELSQQALGIPELAPLTLAFLNVLLLHFPANLFMTRWTRLLPQLTKQAALEKVWSLLAAQAISCISRTALVGSRRGEEDLLDALIQLCGSTNARVRYEGASALLHQVQSQPTSAFFIVHVSEAKDALASMALDEDSAVRAVAVETLSTLASSPLNVNALAKNQMIVDALARNAMKQSQGSKEKIQQHAIVAILRLVVQRRSIAIVAKQSHVVRSLTEYGSSSHTDQLLKTAALRAVTCLSPYI